MQCASEHQLSALSAGLRDVLGRVERRPRAAQRAAVVVAHETLTFKVTSAELHQRTLRSRSITRKRNFFPTRQVLYRFRHQELSLVPWSFSARGRFAAGKAKGRASGEGAWGWRQPPRSGLLQSLSGRCRAEVAFGRAGGAAARGQTNERRRCLLFHITHPPREKYSLGPAAVGRRRPRDTLRTLARGGCRPRGPL